MIITPAEIRWRGDQADAVQYDDIYFRDDALAEAQTIFITPGQIVAKAKAKGEAKATLCVGELGFGMGTNFIATAAAVLAHSNANLRYIAIEKHPLCQADWQHVLDRAEQHVDLVHTLADPGLPLLAGWHERVFANGRITLTVFHGDVGSGLQDLQLRQHNPIDAWLLDGFTPKKNPEMWTPEIYARLAELSTLDTSIATFTSAGHVRRGLQAAGFAMQRLDQSPHKHHSSAGFYTKAGRSCLSPPAKVIVHGAGIGGACMARLLANQGVAVQVFDPGGHPSASHIKAAVLHARLLGDGSAGAQFRANSYHYATSYLKGLPGYQETGALQLQGPNLNAKKLDRIAAAYGAQDTHQSHWLQRVDSVTASELSGFSIEQDSLFFPAAAVIDLPKLCNALLDHDRIEVVCRAAEFDKLAFNILCTAGGTRSFPGCDHLEISQIHGQLDYFSSDQLHARLPVVGNGYLVPTQSGCVLGASYEYTPWDADKARTHNQQINQHLTRSAALTWVSSERGARAVSSDRMPAVGCLDTEHPLWIATAFGSMGTSAAPLAAAMVASQILGWMPPVSADVENLTDPNRFARRQARRGLRHR